MLRHWRNEHRATGVAPRRDEAGKLGTPEFKIQRADREEQFRKKSGEGCDNVGEMRQRGGGECEGNERRR